MGGCLLLFFFNLDSNLNLKISFLDLSKKVICSLSPLSHILSSSCSTVLLFLELIAAQKPRSRELGIFSNSCQPNNFTHLS